MRGAFAAFLLLVCRPAAAFEVDDGTWLLGLNAGLALPQGGASKSAGQGGSLGGQAFYHPFGQWGVGLQVDHHDFKAKDGKDLNASSVMAAARANLESPAYRSMAYVLFGLGYGQTGADLPRDEKDRGGGPGFELGGGYEFRLSGDVSGALEFRIQRLMAGLPRLGLGGVTVATLGLRLNYWMLPGASPFPDR